MRSNSRLLPVAAMCVALGGCGASSVEPVLQLSPVKSAFEGTSERAVVKIVAVDRQGSPGEGTVTLTSTVGHFVDPELTLVAGQVTATFVCDPREEPACVGTIRLGGAWAGVQATTQVQGLAATTPNTVTWEVVPTGVALQAFALERSPANEVWAVGDGGLILKLVGRSWQRLASGVTVALRALTFAADGTPVAVGDEGTLVRMVDGQFQPLTLSQEALTAVTLDDQGVIYAGDAVGQIVSFDPSKGLIRPLTSLEDAVRGLVFRDGVVYAVSPNSFARFDGSWMMDAEPFNGTFNTLRVGAQSLLVGGQREGIVGVDGVLAEGSDAAWSTTQLGAPVLSIAEVPGVAERFALTEQGLFRQLDAQVWKKVECPSSGVSIVSRGAGDLVLVGPAGVSLLRVP